MIVRLENIPETLDRMPLKDILESHKRLEKKLKKLRKNGDIKRIGPYDEADRLIRNYLKDTYGIDEQLKQLRIPLKIRRIPQKFKHMPMKIKHLKSKITDRWNNVSIK
ncbi:MAG: hypothetical protein IJ242_15455 [Clostridia bacterium]|nr:hypothetical protein [Clostridia bacterium]